MTVDPERVFIALVQTGKAGILFSGLSLSCYAFLGSLLVVTNSEPWCYPIFTLTADPVLNGLLSFLGLATVLMSGGLVFLALISRADDTDRLFVLVRAALGIGLGSSLVRFTLPVVIEYTSLP